MNMNMEMVAIKGMVMELNELFDEYKNSDTIDDLTSPLHLNNLTEKVKLLFENRGVDYPSVKVTYNTHAKEVILEPQTTNAMIAVFGLAGIAQT